MQQAHTNHVRITRDGRTLLSGPAYTAFRLLLLTVQDRKCAECQNPITLATMHAHHEGASGYGRGSGGSKRNDQSRAQAAASNQENWAVGLCIPCHRRHDPRWQTARLQK